MKKLSVLTPMYNEEEVAEIFIRAIVPELAALPVDWEIICINDGSTDRTLEVLRKIASENSRVKIINLSRNFGKENALTAGLDFATGDAVVPLDADLQDPPSLLGEMVEAWLAGADVVNAARRRRQQDSWLKRITSQYFYKTMGLISDVTLPADVGDFRLISRRACDAVSSLRERRRFMKGLFTWVGYPTVTVYYDRPARAAGNTKWNYWKLWNFALEGITSFSTVPLRIATYVGIGVASLSFAYAFFLVLKTILLGTDVSGYPSLMTAILFLGGVQLFFVGVLGEYIGRIHDEVKQRPIYLVESTLGL
jgi:polyisoprenyl-phosphate glycosyltransferase